MFCLLASFLPLSFSLSLSLYNFLENKTSQFQEQPRTGVTFPSEVSTRGWTSRPGRLVRVLLGSLKISVLPVFSLRSRERCPSGREGVGEPKKSVSMGQIQQTRASPAATTTRSQDVNGNTGRFQTLHHPNFLAKISSVFLDD